MFVEAIWCGGAAGPISGFCAKRNGLRISRLEHEGRAAAGNVGRGGWYLSCDR